MTRELKASEEIHAVEKDWRADLVPRVGAIAVVMMLLGGLSLVSGFGTGPMHIFGWALIAWSIIMIFPLSTSRVSHRFKSVMIICSIAVASVVTYVLAGYLPGAVGAAIAALIFAALLIGRKTLVFLFAGFVITLVALTISVATGLWSGPDFAGVDPRDPANWMRTTFITIILLASIGFSVTFVIGTIEQNLARLRAALRSLQDEMTERRAAEQARRDAEAVANQAQKMEAVGQLAAAIAHDFNNALLVIKGWNEIRGRTDADDRQRDATAAIEQATEYSARLGKQLLAFARKDVRTPRLLRLDRLVDDMADSLRHLVGAHIEVIIETRPDACVVADESQLQQLIFNLVINARDALAASGKVRISVDHVAARDIEGYDPGCDRCVSLVVEDDGPGIDDAIKQRVFDPFFTTKTAGKGTGLGLTTVANIVQQSGGHIELRSRPGQTRFAVFLPAVAGDIADIEPRAAEEGTKRLELRVLVLEDDPRVRNLIASALTLNGSEVLECDDGDAAIALLEADRRQFDLICSDAVFPGRRLADVLEAFERHSPAGKVLICSGYVQEELAISKLESGDYAFLAKPFSGSELIAKIREISG